MPLIRKSHIDPLRTVSELLSHLQLEGMLDDLEVPHWATGRTSVEELILALRTVGDGEWLTEVYERHGPAEAADKWILTFLAGESVPTPDDLAGGEEPELPSMGVVKAQFFAALPGEEERVRARLDDARDLAELGPRHISELAQSMAACAVMPESEYASHEHPCLDRSRIVDRDLLAVSLFHLGNKKILAAFGSIGEGYAAQVTKRSALLRSQLTDLANQYKSV